MKRGGGTGRGGTNSAQDLRFKTWPHKFLIGFRPGGMPLSRAYRGDCTGALIFPLFLYAEARVLLPETDLGLVSQRSWWQLFHLSFTTTRAGTSSPLCCFTCTRCSIGHTICSRLLDRIRRAFSCSSCFSSRRSLLFWRFWDPRKWFAEQVGFSHMQCQREKCLLARGRSYCA